MVGSMVATGAVVANVWTACVGIRLHSALQVHYNQSRVFDEVFNIMYIPPSRPLNCLEIWHHQRIIKAAHNYIKENS